MHHLVLSHPRAPPSTVRDRARPRAKGQVSQAKGSLCSGLKAWQACRALSYRLRQQPKVQQYDRNLQRGPLPPTWTTHTNVDRNPQRGPQRSVWTERSPWTAALSVDRSAQRGPQRSTWTAAPHSDRSNPQRPQRFTATAALHEGRRAPRGLQRSTRAATRSKMWQEVRRT